MRLCYNTREHDGRGKTEAEGNEMAQYDKDNAVRPALRDDKQMLDIRIGIQQYKDSTVELALRDNRQLLETLDVREKTPQMQDYVDRMAKAGTPVSVTSDNVIITMCAHDHEFSYNNPNYALHTAYHLIDTLDRGSWIMTIQTPNDYELREPTSSCAMTPIGDKAASLLRRNAAFDGLVDFRDERVDVMGRRLEAFDEVERDIVRNHAKTVKTEPGKFLCSATDNLMRYLRAIVPYKEFESPDGIIAARYSHETTPGDGNQEERDVYLVESDECARIVETSVTKSLDTKTGKPLDVSAHVMSRSVPVNEATADMLRQDICDVWRSADKRLPTELSEQLLDTPWSHYDNLSDALRHAVDEMTQMTRDSEHEDERPAPEWDMPTAENECVIAEKQAPSFW